MVLMTMIVTLVDGDDGSGDIDGGGCGDGDCWDVDNDAEEYGGDDVASVVDGGDDDGDEVLPVIFIIITMMDSDRSDTRGSVWWAIIAFKK